MGGARAGIVVAAALMAGAAAAPKGPPPDLPRLLERIGARVEQFYARAQSIVCLETVKEQPVSFDLSPEGGHVRQLVYELRVSWDPAPAVGAAPEAKVLRELVKVDGRAPRPGDKPGCIDPKPVSSEPLEKLLPGNQHDYVFTWAGTGRVGRRDSVMLDYKEAATIGEAAMTFKEECISIELPGRGRGRVWVDALSGDVLRLDEGLTGMPEVRIPKEHVLFNGPTWMIVERADQSIRYQPVVFHDPDETLLLPSSIETLTIIRNSGTRTRMTQTFSDYKRFMTGARIVKDPGPR